MRRKILGIVGVVRLIYERRRNFKDSKHVKFHKKSTSRLPVENVPDSLQKSLNLVSC